MDNDNLKRHIDSRFDKLEDTVKLYGEQLVVHKTQIASLQGFTRVALAVFLSCVGFLAAAFFHK